MSANTYNAMAPVVDLLDKRLELSLKVTSPSEGYATMFVGGTWHYYSPITAKSLRLKPSCSHASDLPRMGAKLKRREDLPEGARTCKTCEANRQTRGYFETIDPKEK